MAQKEVAIKIKIDGKELDAAKLSVDQFEKIYSDAQKKLNTLPLGSNEWKQLNQEVNNSEKAFQQTKEIVTETEGKFKSLRLQIRQATVAFQEAEEKGDMKGMQVAKKNLQDLNDQLEVTTLKSMEFKDALAQMPGVAGLVGQSIQGIDMAFKVLVANPILATITAIVGAFVFMKNALSKTTEGQAALNKVSQAFSKIMGPILALINMVAIPIFEKLADIIGAVGSAFSFFAEKLGVSKKSIAQATKDVDEVGKTAAENEKKRQEEAKKKEEERAKKAQEALQKAKELAEARKRLAQDTINTNEALIQSENELANSTIKKSDDVIEALKQEQSYKDAALIREKKRVDDLMKLESAGSIEYKKLQAERNALDVEYNTDKIEREKAVSEELKIRLEKEAEFISKVREYKIAAIEDETKRNIASRESKLAQDLSDLEKDKEFLKRTEDEKAEIRKNLQVASQNDINRILMDVKLKGYQDELTLLEAQQKTLQEGTQAYLDNSLAIENEAYRIKLTNAKNNAVLIQAIETEHEQNIKNIKLQALIAEKQIAIERMGVIASIGSSLQALAGKNKAVAIAGIVIEKAASIGQIIANTGIANAKAVAASPLTFGQPWVTINTISAGLSVAASVASAAKAISEIGGTNAGGGGAAGATAAPAKSGADVGNLGRNYEVGGIIGGRRHAQGGTLIEAEKGEAIMTRGAVTMFAPMLSMMNQMGGGTSFAPNAMTTSPDNPINVSQERNPVIMKTYIVENELTSNQQKQARLKDLSTL